MKPDTASLWAAAKRFEGVLRKDPAALSFAPLADVYRRLGLLDEALETARKGCRLHPDFAAGQMSLAKAALESGSRDEAVTSLEVVVRVTPENLEAQRLLADLYSAAGDAAAAQRCLFVASTLEMDVTEAAPPADQVAPFAEETSDGEILDLSDELIEEQSFDNAMGQFAALPERPSIGAANNRAEPFLLEVPPPLSPEEPLSEASPPMASATIAELYISQGFPDKGAAVYRELLAADPLNATYATRLAKLPGPEIQPPAERREIQAEGLLDKLQEWLGMIGRVRECRTRNL